MAAPSRMDRLIKALGGEQNLPPKLAQPVDETVTSQQDEAIADSNQDLQPIEEFLEQHQPAQEEWWNAKPKIVQPALPQISHPRTTIASGDSHAIMSPAPLGMSFCPLIAITKFPYKFVSKRFMQPIASAFFDEGKIWEREWEVYSVNSTVYSTGKAILFVPESQVQGLIDEINAAFPKANVKITDSNREEGLAINFDEIPHPELRPHFLGHSNARPQIDTWTDNCPCLTPKMSVPESTLEAFKAKIQAAADVSKTKSKAKRDAKHAENVVKRTGMGQMLIRTQQYLGLPPMQQEGSMPDLSTLSISASLTERPPPGPFNEDAIFMAVDVEALEESRNTISEVGLATLDTRDLHFKAPGTNGEDWQKCIKARHFRISEHKNMVNHKYVDGCPDKFEFGASDFVDYRDISQTVGDCFKPPYGSPLTPTESKFEKRKVVLVGHDINSDINYLRKIGVHVPNFTCIIDTVDTAMLYRVIDQQQNPRSLGTILAAFDLIGWHLHNAGNDAVYTLWAMLATCLKASSGETKEEREQKLRERMDAATEQARERAREEVEGWDAAEDGGVPVPPTFGPERPGKTVFYTSGGAVLDV